MVTSLAKSIQACEGLRPTAHAWAGHGSRSPNSHCTGPRRAEGRKHFTANTQVRGQLVNREPILITTVISENTLYCSKVTVNDSHNGDPESPRNIAVCLKPCAEPADCAACFSVGGQRMVTIFTFPSWKCCAAGLSVLGT